MWALFALFWVLGLVGGFFMAIMVLGDYIIYPDDRKRRTVKKNDTW